MTIFDVVKAALDQMPYVRDSRYEYDPNALAKLDAAMAAMSVDDLPALEIIGRGMPSYGVETPERYQALLDRSFGAAAVLSLHRNGYLREAAVRTLAASRSGLALNFLLLRVNDWVPQIRTLATQLVRTYLLPRHTHDFVRCLMLVDRLRIASRADHALLIQEIESLVSAQLSTLHDALRGGSSRYRRAVFRTLLRVSNARDAIRIALANTDPSVRFEALRLVAVHFDAGDARALYEGAMRDRNAHVRREALTQLAGDREWLERALFDANAGNRELAQYRLRDAQIDFAARYRDALATSQPKSLAIAIAGLGTTGSANDVQRLSPFLMFPTALVRRAAIKAIARLGGMDAIDLLLPSLDDSASSVSTATRIALLPNASVIGAAALERALDSVNTAHARRNVVRLMNALSKWPRILCLLRATKYEEVAALAREKIAQWNKHYSQSQAVPSRKELHELEAALKDAAGRVDERLIEHIRFALTAYA